ncbi:BURP domain-containing protein BNM2A-like isoform X3 [Abrus precatorius]|uniref:BURP domain-containing protein BNM2A-like isoform X3 n=1 Tax=Abrus precatorius TaxID=3816 RepID=A0A8B8LLU7_ABRPR|nr:BURP domain-containing protein BNM2A-like isoform X3 [Abrus precatorius]
MRLGSASWSFILCTLLLSLILQDSGAREISTTSGKYVQLKEVSNDMQKLATEGLVLNNILQLEGAAVEISMKHVHEDEDDDDDDDDDRVNKGKRVDKEEHKKIIGKDVHVDHNHMDLELNVFFTPSDLKVGKIMPIYFSKKNSSTSPKFLTREEAEEIPFSSKRLSFLLKFFSISKHTPQAKAMKYTLKQCEFESMEGETKFCATSLESLFDFARYMFGSNAQFKVLTTTHLTNSTALLQNYTISEVKVISVPNIIGCHPMPYPYAVFYCHSQKSDTKVYEVLVEGENGGRVQAAAICHMDTSKWDKDHVSFRVLNVKPGTSPVCHFFPPDNLVWVPLIGAP